MGSLWVAGVHVLVLLPHCEGHQTSNLFLSCSFKMLELNSQYRSFEAPTSQLGQHLEHF